MATDDPTWDLYRSFLTVLRTGTLSAAARELDLTQPTVGRHIATLEKTLGRRALFTRSQAGLRPTEAAHELRPHAEAMAAAAAALLRAASAEPDQAAGVVRLTAADVIGAEVLPPILAEFRRRHPAIAVELLLSNQVADLLRRDADIAVRMARPEQKALLAKRAGKISLGLYAHRRYVERYGSPQRLEDLFGHALIGFDRAPPFRALVKAVPVQLTREAFAFRCDNDLAHLPMIRAGFGIGACQHGIARRYPDLLPLLSAQFRIDLEMWIVMHNDLRRSHRMRLMFDHLAAGLAQYAATGH
jgi:DNA-binding transcriptional LysR family regulator